MFSSKVVTVLNHKLKCQLLNIRAFSTARINCESSSEQKQDTKKNEPPPQQQQQQQQQPRKLGAWVAVALTAGAVSYYFLSYRRTKERLCAEAEQMRADLPSFSAKDVVERKYYVYGVGVYDLNDYAKKGHPGGEKSITDLVGKSIEEIWATESMRFHRKKEILDLLEGMRIGNVEGEMDKSQRCKPPKVVPQVNAQEYRLELKIDGGNNLKSLSLEELRRYPKYSIVSSIPCKSDPTKTEAGSTWTGVQLRDILREYKITKSDYDQIRFECLDVTSTTEKPYGSTVPVDRVLNEANFDVLLAYEQDGSEISPQHGYPVRVVMPQAAGARNVKWLSRVVLIKKADKVV